MNIRKQRGYKILGALGVLLLLVSVAVAYLWFYRLAPFRRSVDPSWRRMHSAEAAWMESQKSLERTGWTFGHSDRPLATWGGKPVVEWLMGHVSPEDKFGCLGADFCHGGVTLRYMTNQGFDEDASDWLQWWETNQTNTQEEWILAGFRENEIDVGYPPLSVSQTVSLLNVVGERSDKTPDCSPRYLRFNAFRWLRDSGFDAMGFAVSDASETMSEITRQGLIEYDRYEDWNPKKDRVGILAFGDHSDPLGGQALPLLVSPRYTIIAHLLITVSALAGLLMIALSLRRKPGIGGINPPLL